MIAAGTPVAPAPITTTSAWECHATIAPRYRLSALRSEAGLGRGQTTG
jgi:hypothetical protein